MFPQGRAFRPQSPTVSVAVTASSVNSVFAGWIALSGVKQLRVVNEGPNTIYIEFGEGTSVPTAAVGTSLPLLANTVEVFTIGGDKTSISFISSATGNTIRFTGGEGL